MIFVVISVMTIVKKIVETIPNQRLATRSRLTLGSTSCADSLAMSVTTPSAGVSRMLTENAALTAPKPAAMPASGCRPTLMNAAAARGISTKVAGVRRDARDDADEHDDVGQRSRRRDRHQLADQRPDEPRVLGHADADHRDQDHPDGCEPQEVGDERREDEGDAGRGQQPLGLDVLGPQRIGGVVGGVVGQLIRRAGGMVCDLLGDADVGPVEDLGEDDHEEDQPEEQDRRVRDAVARPLDPGEHALREPAALGRPLRESRRLGAHACPFRAAVNASA